MKRFSLIALAVFCTATFSFAQSERNERTHTSRAQLEQLTRSVPAPQLRQRLADAPTADAKAHKNSLKAPRKSPKKVLNQQPDGTLYDNLVASYSAIAYSWFGGYYNASETDGVASIVEGTDGYIYVRNLVPYAGSDVWLKGEREEGDIVVFHLQEVGFYDYGGGDSLEFVFTRLQYDEENGEYITPLDGVTDVRFHYSNGTLTAVDELTTDEDLPDYAYGVQELYTEDGETEVYWDAIYWNTAFVPQTDSYVVPPTNAETEELVLKYVNVETNHADLIPVVFAGNEFYFKPYNRVPGWIVGTIDGDKITVRNQQYLGADSYYGTHTYAHAAEAELVFVEDEEYPQYSYWTDRLSIIDQVEFSYDAENKELKAEKAISVDGAKSSIYYAAYYKEPQLYVFNEVAAVPADPIFTYYSDYSASYGYGLFDVTIPQTDVDGNYIKADLLSYTVYFDDEAFEFEPDEYFVDETLSEIPYTFDNDDDITTYYGDKEIYFYFSLAKNIGVQSIYRGAGTENRSATVWYDIESGETYTTAVENHLADNAVKDHIVGERYFDASGREVSRNAQGFVIKSVSYEDGSRKSYKVVRK